MANTPARAIRIPEDEWNAARERAAREGETLTHVIREALREYVTAPESATESS